MTYKAALAECEKAHRDHGDMIGAHAISAMASMPQSDHKAFAFRRFNHAREVCINAIDYANQQVAA